MTVSWDPTTYDDEFAPHLGPPPVTNYGGPGVLEQREPVQIVELDAGAFRALWELLEAEAKHRWPIRKTMSTARAYLRAVESFRSSYWFNHEPPPDPSARRIERRRGRRSVGTAAAPSSPSNGRVIRRP